MLILSLLFLLLLEGILSNFVSYSIFSPVKFYLCFSFLVYFSFFHEKRTKWEGFWFLLFGFLYDLCYGEILGYHALLYGICYLLLRYFKKHSRRPFLYFLVILWIYLLLEYIGGMLLFSPPLSLLSFFFSFLTVFFWQCFLFGSLLLLRFVYPRIFSS